MTTEQRVKSRMSIPGQPGRAEVRSGSLENVLPVAATNRRPGIEPQDPAEDRSPEGVGVADPRTLTEFSPVWVDQSRKARFSHPAEELTLESLILAQDERWRRA